MNVTDLYTFFLEDWGWIVFALIALIAALIVLFDSRRRHISAGVWLFSLMLCLVVYLVMGIYAFSNAEVRASMQGFRASLFYLGVSAGIAPLLLLAGYFIAYRDIGGSANIDTGAGPYGFRSPQYRLDLQGSESDVQAEAKKSNVNKQKADENAEPVFQPPIPQMPVAQLEAMNRPRAAAWLIDFYNPNFQFQLYTDSTKVGRNTNNDLIFEDNLQVSKEHFRIRAIAENRFVIHDMGSSGGTYVNGQRLIQEHMLSSSDIIQIANLQFRFVQ